MAASACQPWAPLGLLPLCTLGLQGCGPVPGWACSCFTVTHNCVPEPYRGGPLRGPGVTREQAEAEA